MKLAISILCMITTATTCLSQERSRHESMVGIDIFHILTDYGLRIEISHAVNAKWSADAEAIFNPMRRERYIEEKAHHMLLQDRDSAQESPKRGSHAGSISLKYWPAETYQGPFLSMGIKFGNSTAADAAAGIGYMIRIWKGTAVSFRYETGVLETGNISFCINHIF